MSTLENNDVIDADIIDIECADESTDKQIRGRAKYWSPSQVADILDIPVSTVRYYAIQFADLLDYPVVNKQKKFLDSDIEKLKFILELKNDGMSLQQIKEYCSEVSFTENGIQVKESNPLTIQAMAKALLEEQNMQFKDFKKELLQELNENAIKMFSMNEDMLQKAREEVAITVDEVVSEKLNEFKAEYEKQRQEEIDIRQREIEQREMLLLKMEENKKRYEEENRGFFKKLFKR